MTAETIAAYIRDKAGHQPVRIGLVLGSGLGHLAEAVDGVSIPYADLGGFPHAGVSGHNPKLVIGDLEGVRVAVFGGRAHYYEKGDAATMRRHTPDHILLAGPPGLGKTTLSMIVASELDKPLHQTSGPAIQHAGDVAAVLSALTPG